MIAPEFSRVVDVGHLADGESELSIEATAEEAAKLARRFDLEKIDRLAADLRLTADHAAGEVRLDGMIEAEIVQTCVVTLEPIPVSIKAPILRKYSAAAADENDSEDIDISGEDEEAAEPIHDGTIDVGEAVAEQLALEIDPFPRLPGVDFKGFSSDSADQGRSGPDSEAPTGPFAALARLKKPPENDC